MLNQFLEDILEDFKTASVWDTKGIYTDVYPEEVVQELDNICSRLRVLKGKLDTEDFKGSYKFSEKDLEVKYPE